MGPVLLDLSNRYRSAFGFAPVLKSPESLPGGQYAPYPAGASVYTPPDNTFEELQLKGNGFDLTFGSAALSKSGSMGRFFAPPPMLGWHKAKNQTITPIDGSDGEVIERYGDQAWEFRMQGLLIDMEDHQFPFDALAQLRKVFNVADSWEVYSKFFDALDIHNIYFSEVDITPLQGYQDTCSYSLTARSIKASEFYLNGEAGA